MDGRRIGCWQTRVRWGRCIAEVWGWGAALADREEKGQIEQWRYACLGAPKEKRSQCWIVGYQQEKQETQQGGQHHRWELPRTLDL